MSYREDRATLLSLVHSEERATTVTKSSRGHSSYTAGGGGMYFTTRAMHLSHAQRGQGTPTPGVTQTSEDQCSKKSVPVLMLALFSKKN